MTGHDIVVIGTSAGGREALCTLVSQLPVELPATLFVVQHMSSNAIGARIVQYIQRNTSWKCDLANNGDTFSYSHIVIEPPGRHILLKEDRILLTNGPHENRFRPSIDALFRSAAASYGPRVIGIVLTGLLDDGTAGLTIIRKAGGIVIVQDPDDAAYPDMPLSVLHNMEVDYCLPVPEIGSLLTNLVHQPIEEHFTIPHEILLEADIAERAMGSIEIMKEIGEAIPYICPDCGGPLWHVQGKALHTYRCHVGHSFTEKILMQRQEEKLEETLWVAMRILEERKNMLTMMIVRDRDKGFSSLTSDREVRLRETQVHIDRLRQLLTSTIASTSNSDPIGSE